MRSADGKLALLYVLTGKLDEIRIPGAARPERRDALWQHTCFEAFVRGAGGAYYEFNFAPSTEWAAYQFAGYRSGSHILEMEPPRIETQSSADIFLLSSQLVLGESPNLPAGSPWSLGLSAVIEEMNGRKSYWALVHPSGKADFHHADCFVHQLPECSTP